MNIKKNSFYKSIKLIIFIIFSLLSFFSLFFNNNVISAYSQEKEQQIRSQIQRAEEYNSKSANRQTVSQPIPFNPDKFNNVTTEWINSVVPQQTDNSNDKTKEFNPDKFKDVTAEWINSVIPPTMPDPNKEPRPFNPSNFNNVNQARIDSVIPRQIVNSNDKPKEFNPSNFNNVTTEWINNVAKNDELERKEEERERKEEEIRQAYKKQREYHEEYFRSGNTIYNGQKYETTPEGALENRKNEYNILGQKVDIVFNSVEERRAYANTRGYHTKVNNYTHPTSDGSAIVRNFPYILTTDIAGKQIKTDLYNAYYDLLSKFKDNQKKLNEIRHKLEVQIENKKENFNQALEKNVIEKTDLTPEEEQNLTPEGKQNLSSLKKKLNILLKEELNIFLKDIPLEPINQGVDFIFEAHKFQFEDNFLQKNYLILEKITTLNQQFEKNTKESYEENDKNFQLIPKDLEQTYQKHMLDLKLRFKAFLTSENKEAPLFQDVLNAFKTIIDKLQTTNEANIELTLETIQNKIKAFETLIKKKTDNIDQKYRKIKEEQGLDGINLLDQKTEIDNLKLEANKLIEHIKTEQDHISKHNNLIKEQIDKINKEWGDLKRPTTIDQTFHEMLKTHFNEMAALKNLIDVKNAELDEWIKKFEEIKQEVDEKRQVNLNMLDQIPTNNDYGSNVLKNQIIEQFVSIQKPKFISDLSKKDKETSNTYPDGNPIEDYRNYKTSFDHYQKIRGKFEALNELIAETSQDINDKIVELTTKYATEKDRRNKELQELMDKNKKYTAKMKNKLETDPKFVKHCNKFRTYVNGETGKQTNSINQFNDTEEKSNTDLNNLYEKRRDLLEEKLRLNQTFFQNEYGNIKNELSKLQDIEKEIDTTYKNTKTQEGLIKQALKDIEELKRKIKDQIESLKNTYLNVDSVDKLIKQENIAYLETLIQTIETDIEMDEQHPILKKNEEYENSIVQEIQRLTNLIDKKNKKRGEISKEINAHEKEINDHAGTINQQRRISDEYQRLSWESNAFIVFLEGQKVRFNRESSPDWVSRQEDTNEQTIKKSQDEIEKDKKETLDLKTKIKTKKQEIEALQKEIDSYSFASLVPLVNIENLSNLNREATYLNGDINYLEKNIKFNESLIKLIKKEPLTERTVDTLETLIGLKKQDIQFYENKRTDIKNKINELQAKIEELKTLIKIKEEEIARLDKEINQHALDRKENNSLLNIEYLKQRLIRDLKSEISGKKSLINENKANIKTLRTQFENAFIQANEQSKKIKDLYLEYDKNCFKIGLLDGVAKTAYHETGHVIGNLKGNNEISFVTIIPNEKESYKGVTVANASPLSDKKQQLLMTLAGTASEKRLNEQYKLIKRRIGLGSGQRNHEDSNKRSDNYVAYELMKNMNIVPNDPNYDKYIQESKNMLENNSALLEEIVRALLFEKETLYKDDIDKIVNTFPLK
ncbi:hypothetical protein [Candidatus Phytoplasma pruni]|uniref:Uncharacterized protein n=1 Tax=Candidatus Phytoplasma pruni TaxID=479893 RepID=A0A851HD50_9MOLU|nr:hypothetical protein [Candidatus Phytoplasma pruni]NWN46011.1 hypothetical protein [Candidatus Phytoplasma pruni]